MKPKSKIIAVAAGVCWLGIGAFLPYRAFGLLFCAFVIGIGLMFLYSATFGRHLSWRIRFGAFIFGMGICSLGAAHIAEALGLSWATPELREKIFLFVFLPSWIPAFFLLPRGIQLLPPRHTNDKKPNA